MRVLITGANGGLGAAVAEQFLLDGASVIGVARSWPSGGPDFTRLNADLTQPAECARVASEAGDIDALVHLVGGFAAGSDAGTWRRMLAINIETAANIIEACLPGLKRRGRGAVVAVGSRVAVEPVPGLAAYGASKAALVHYVRTLALELKDSGVRANIVLPSTIDTAANREAMPSASAADWVSPAEIANVIVWLVSGDAAVVSGAVVPVYGRA